MSNSDNPTNEEIEREKKEFDETVLVPIASPMEQIHSAKSVFIDRLYNLVKSFELQTGCYIEDIGLEHDMHMGEYKSTSIVEVTVGLPKEPFFTEARGDME